MSERSRMFRHAIADALRVGVSKDDVAIVVVELKSEPELDPDVLRVALMQYAPVDAFRRFGPDEDEVECADRIRADRADRIEAMWADGWLIREIAPVVGMRESQLSGEIQWMRDHGWDMPLRYVSTPARVAA